MNSDHGQDIEGTRYESIQMGGSFGYRSMMLIYDPDAKFTEWDEEYLLLAAKNLIASARDRNASEKKSQ